MEQTFEITITSCKNCTIQGTLTAEDGAAFPFRSELELLLELARRLLMEDSKTPPDAGGPVWKEAVEEVLNDARGEEKEARL